jgi:Holliday junction resolvase RusA-like endonuclease
MRLDPKEPPIFGELEFSVPCPAVSQQAGAAAKADITEKIRAITRPLEYLLDDDVTVDIEWTLHESTRWETDASADMDNIVKPLLDALCGPKGILIDDCLVRSFSSTWMSWTARRDRVTVRIKYDADHYLIKEGLVFVRIHGALCYPVPKDVREKALDQWLEMLAKFVETRTKIERLTGAYYPARGILPRGFIHRTRLKDFPVYSPDQIRRL